MEHEWISYDDATTIGTIGITEYAQKALGDVVYVELPTVATTVATGGTFPTPLICSSRRDAREREGGTGGQINRDTS